MNELQQPDPKEVIAKQHLQKKTSSVRIPPGCKLFAVNRRTGECSEVKIDISLVSHNEKRLHGMVTDTLHHKVTQSNSYYVIAVNQKNALRKWDRVKHRLQLPAEE